MNVFKASLSAILIVVIALSCKTDPKPVTEDTIVNVALDQSPARISPLLSASSIAREVFAYLYYPVADYDPESLELSPILVKAIPEAEIINGGPYNGMTGYTYEFRDEAKWDDGSDITVKDYIFTLKCAMLPLVEAQTWRNYFDSFKDVIEYEDDSKKFTVVTDSRYFLVKEASCTFEIYPEYIYDANGVLKDIPLLDFFDSEKISALAEKDTSLQNYAREINSGK